MNKIKKILILGGGQAAAYAAKEIRLIDKNSDAVSYTHLRAHET